MNKCENLELMVKTIKVSHGALNLEASGYSMNEIINLVNTLSGAACSSREPKTETISKTYNRKTDVEEFDMTKLGKDVRMPKLTSDFRCPSCAQGVILKHFSINEGVDPVGVYLVKDIRGEKPRIYSVEILDIPEVLDDDGNINKETFIKVYSDLLDLLDEEKMIVESSTDTGYCPVCGETHAIKDWIEAASDTLKYFDTLQVCAICGDEGDITVTESGDKVLCKDECLNKF